jgi:MFS family permease
VVFGLVVLIAALAYVLPAGTLGHDESVYAVKARSWLVATPATGFSVYRPVGMPVVGWLVLHVSETEVALRIAATAIAVGAIITMWAIGRAMLGPVAAVVGTAIFIASESYLRRATEFLNDLASAGLLLVTIFFIWLHFERHPDRWWLLAAAPAAAAAYYMRYGSLFGLIVVAVVGGAIWFRSLAASWRQIAATVGLLIAMLIPHFWYSQQLTGSALGVFWAARAHAAGVGGFGLDDYLRFFPERLTGTVGAVVMVSGVVYTIMLVIAARKDHRHRFAARTASFLTVTAVAMTILLGLFTHGEPRFIFLPLMALLLVGGQAVAVALSRISDVARRVAIAGLIVVLGYALVTGAGQMHNRMGAITARRSVVAETAELVHTDAGTDSCTVQSAYVPQVTWYSRCATYGFGYDGPPGDHAYLVVFADSDRQPTTAQLEALLVDTNSEPIQVVPDAGGVYGDGYVYELAVTSAP